MTATSQRASGAQRGRRSFLRKTAAGFILTIGGLLTATPASAASASIEAKPDEVVVTTAGNSGQTTISWDLDGFKSKVYLKRRIDSGSWQVVKSGVKQTDQEVFTVQHPHTYTFSLDADENQHAPIPGNSKVVVTTKLLARATVDIDWGCAEDCIISHAVSPLGTHAFVTVKTNEPASFLVEVSTSAPDANLSFAGKSIDSSTFSLNKQNQWTSTLLKLLPDTAYHYVVTAKDGKGKEHKEKGTFTTLKRKITVTFQKIEVIDDSDDLSDGDLGFFFIANGKQVAWPGNNPGSDWAGTGAMLNPNQSITLIDAPDSLKVEVHGFDNDDDPDVVLTLDTCGTGGGLPPGISCEDYDEGYASATFSIDQSGPGEAYSQGFAFQTQGNANDLFPLKFKVHGSFQVSYVP